MNGLKKASLATEALGVPKGAKISIGALMAKTKKPKRSASRDSYAA